MAYELELSVKLVADLERSLGKLLCKHIFNSLAIYALYIHELPPSFRTFVSHRITSLAIDPRAVVGIP